MGVMLHTGVFDLKSCRIIALHCCAAGLGKHIPDGMTMNQCLTLGMLFIPARFKTRPEYQRLFEDYNLHVREEPVDTIIRKVTGTPYCIELWRHHSQSYIKKIPQEQFMAFQSEKQIPMYRCVRCRVLLMVLCWLLVVLVL